MTRFGNCAFESRDRSMPLPIKRTSNGGVVEMQSSKKRPSSSLSQKRWPTHFWSSTACSRDTLLLGTPRNIIIEPRLHSGTEVLHGLGVRFAANSSTEIHLTAT